MRFTPFLMQLLFQNKLIKKLVRFLFLGYCKKRELKFRKRVSLLQNSYYKDQFSYIHAINREYKT